MTDNKPKIDLKSRLGKKTVSSPTGASIPPPVGLSRPSAIPAPPFASRPAAAMGSSAPYSALDGASVASPPRVEPQAIKVEMSEEVRQAQKKQSRKHMLMSIFTAIAGGILGYAIGGGAARNAVANQAVVDAGELGKQIKGAMVTAETLADTLKAAREQLSSGKYPEAEVAKLGELRVPFGGDKLGGRNIGRFKPEVTRGLLALTTQAEKVNDQVDVVQRLLTSAKKPLLDNFAQASTPKVQWVAYAGNGSAGPVLTMMAVPEPFTMKADKWPESLKFKVGGKDKELKRYVKGNVVGEDPLFIPVDPTSQNGVCPADVLFRVARQVQELESLLRGGKDDSGNDETGMIDSGRALEEKLKAIGGPS
jgi:hypothetical protein